MRWLLALMVFSLSACGHNKLVVDVCVVDVAMDGLDCIKHQDGSKYFVHFRDADNYLALSPPDASTLLNFVANCKQK